MRAVSGSVNSHQLCRMQVRSAGRNEFVDPQNADTGPVTVLALRGHPRSRLARRTGAWCPEREGSAAAAKEGRRHRGQGQGRDRHRKQSRRSERSRRPARSKLRRPCQRRKPSRQGRRQERVPPAMPSPLPPDDSRRLKEAVSAARKGRSSQAGRRAQDDRPTRSPASWSNGRSCAATRTRASTSAATWPSSWKIPTGPRSVMLRRRAEATLWSDRRDPAFVRAYFGKERPATTKGRFALARALLLQGDRAGAQGLVRAAWRYDNFSGELEDLALDVFRDLLTSADHKARMDIRLYAEDAEGAMRSANRRRRRRGRHRQGPHRGDQEGVERQGAARRVAGGDAAATSVSFSAGCSCCVATTRRPRPPQLILSLPNDPAQAIDPDQWWIERRLISRKLLDVGDAKAAYRIASGAALPNRENYRAREPVHRRAGSRCASSTNRRPRSPISRRSAMALATRSRWRAAATGRAARQRRSAAPAMRAHTTRLRRATPPPTTARSHAQSSVARTSSCGRLRSPFEPARSGGPRTRSCARSSCSTPSRSAIWWRERSPISASG